MPAIRCIAAVHHARDRVKPTLTPEQELCLLLARSTRPEPAQTRTRELFRQINWSDFLQLAVTQQVLPLVCRSLSADNFVHVPVEVKSEMQLRFAANALHNAALGTELARLLRSMADAGVPAVPLKGPALAESLYGETMATPRSSSSRFIRLVLSGTSMSPFYDGRCQCSVQARMRAKELALYRGGL